MSSFGDERAVFRAGSIDCLKGDLFVATPKYVEADETLAAPPGCLPGAKGRFECD